VNVSDEEPMPKRLRDTLDDILEWFAPPFRGDIERGAIFSRAHGKSSCMQMSGTLLTGHDRRRSRRKNSGDRV
jgi:hypothetical protein